MNPKHDPQPDPATTFRDDPPAPSCPECGSEPIAVSRGEYTCGRGHKWVPTERRLKTGRG